MKECQKENGFTIIELIVIVIILGIIAAVAIPAFINYMRRARTSEATLMLDRMWEGASKYFNREHPIRGTNEVVSHALPGDAPLTPTIDKISGDKLQAAVYLPVFQSNPTWNALDFAMTDNFYYAYGFKSCNLNDGSCADGSVVNCVAKGNLDGDSIYSTFERSGQVTNAEGSGWALEGAGGVYKDAPLE